MLILYYKTNVLSSDLCPLFCTVYFTTQFVVNISGTNSTALILSPFNAKINDKLFPKINYDLTATIVSSEVPYNSDINFFST